jgi:alpha-tubulin suppressor-like RCC1 family protein
VAGGAYHSLGLKSDGSIVAWGDNDLGQCSVPSPNTGFLAVAGGAYHSLGLKSDGSIVAWGRNDYGQCSVPSPNTGFLAVAAGYYHSLGVKRPGTGSASAGVKVGPDRGSNPSRIPRRQVRQ